MRLAVTSTRSAGAIGAACFTATTCRACRGPITRSKATSVIPVAACCGPQVKRASRNARCNAKARGNSSRALQQRPGYSRPCAKPHSRSWHKKGNALLRIASVSACRAGPCDRPERNSIACVRGGRRYSRQAQGDFRDIANKVIQYLLHPLLQCRQKCIETPKSTLLDTIEPRMDFPLCSTPLPILIKYIRQLFAQFVGCL